MQFWNVCWDCHNLLYLIGLYSLNRIVFPPWRLCCSVGAALGCLLIQICLAVSGNQRTLVYAPTAGGLSPHFRRTDFCVCLSAVSVCHGIGAYSSSEGADRRDLYPLRFLPMRRYTKYFEITKFASLRIVNSREFFIVYSLIDFWARHY